MSRGRYVVIGRGGRISPTAAIWNFAYLGDRVVIGDRVVVGSLTHIGSDVTVGEQTQIEGAAYIADGTQIGRGCFIGPRATITNDAFPPVRRATGVRAWKRVVIEDGAIVGAGACVRAGVRIGSRAVIGMGAVVLEDVVPGAVVAGMPARKLYARHEYDRRQRQVASAQVRGGEPAWPGRS